MGLSQTGSAPSIWYLAGKKDHHGTETKTLEIRAVPVHIALAICRARDDGNAAVLKPLLISMS
jgi:hypothetical protein